MTLDGDKDAPVDHDDHLVVVGSSAGGIEALSVLLGKVPPDFPAPIVLAQHLDPSRPSFLAQILERKTSLPVVTVQDTSRLDPGKVYLVPSDRHIVIKDGHVESYADQKRPRPSIDMLLSSAAQAYGDRLIAVILTGSGSDGAAGAVEVKAAGGVVLIQDPATAAYPSMPLALPPTAVDHTVDLSDIAPLLVDLVTGVPVPEPETQPTQALSAILSTISAQAKIDFRPYKSNTVVRRIGRRMAVTRNATIEDYRHYLETHPAEVAELVKALLINVTEFFRDAEAFAFLRSHVLPEIIRRGRELGHNLRLWSAGCATGEEPYSLALLVADVLGTELPEWTVKIFATDVDAASIEFARRGLYPTNVLRNLPDDYRNRFFETADHGCRVSKLLRGMVIFGQQDLVKGAPFPRIDLVVCRNLLIYFKPDLQQEILDLFAYSLAGASGYLFLGKAETARPSRAAYELVNKKWKVYRCVGSPIQAVVRRGIAAESSYPRHGRDPRIVQQVRTEAMDREQRERAPDVIQMRRFNELLLRHVTVGIVVIDRGYRILTINSAARRLLGIRDATTNADFLHSIRGLPYRQVREAVDAVIRDNSVASVPPLLLDPASGGEGRHVRMSFAALQTDAGPFVGVTVSDATELVDTQKRLGALQTEQKQLLEEQGASHRRLQELNKGLQDTNEELQATNEELMLAQEELQASNEEFEATNEELQATNEELETSNEELQATNEELVATNEELTSRTSELQELTRILSGERVRLANIADMAPFYIVVLRGKEMQVESVNPSKGRLFGGISAMGRRFEDVAKAAALPDLSRSVLEAIEHDHAWGSSRMMTLVPEEDEHTVERAFIFTVVPSHGKDGRVEGAVLYAEDVTERTALEQEESRERLRLMVEHAEQVALALFESRSATLLYASPRYFDLIERSSGLVRKDAVGRHWQELTFLPSGREAMALFQQVVSQGEHKRLAEVRRPSHRGQETVWDCSLIPIRSERTPEGVEYVLVSAVEVTEQVRAREELERLDHLKDEFLSLASHELRTPLVPLNAYSELLARMVVEVDKSGDWNTRFADMMAKLQRQLGHLGRMTDDLLDVGRLQSGKLTIEQRPVNLTDLLPQIVEQVRTVRPGNALTLEMDDADVRVLGDEGRLTQVVMNVLENAFKYGDSREVTLRARRVPDGGAGFAQIEIQDRGPGIPAHELHSVFTRFFQGTREGRSARGGLGLGLYIARGIVEQHGGTIGIDSGVGVGTRVTVRLPLAAPQVS
jgi:two-component system, chemotaxis family, CheB/CheR fusion protein